MARFELKLPRMGESVAEGTITNWIKQVGDSVEVDDVIVEIATDKVDNEIPSEVSGVLVSHLFNKDDIVRVGQTIAIIETKDAITQIIPQEVKEIEKNIQQAKEIILNANTVLENKTSKFLSPLVKNIVKQEEISNLELENIQGTGSEGRITKDDILQFLSLKQQTKGSKLLSVIENVKTPEEITKTPIVLNSGDEVIEMSRMRKLISSHMTKSLQISAHVQSFIEVDVTNIVKWREKVKNVFEKRENEKLTYTPVFMQAVAKALKDFPEMNIVVDENNIIKKKNINLGMATALPNGNLIVPVIKNADQLNLVGMAKAVNDLSQRARTGKLKPDDTQGGTYTVTNIGSFGSVFGTPIINQPEVGILAIGAIRKMPAVIETSEGDFIGIRQKMFLSHSYDHRVIDGALGGNFVKKVAEYLENFDLNSYF